MIDRLVALVRHQVLLADIGDVSALGILGQQVIEGLVLGRTQRFGNRLIPFVAVGEDRIDVEDHSTKIEEPVADDFADCEARGGKIDFLCHGG